MVTGVRERNLQPLQSDRLVQRLCEIGTYWITALLALPAG